MDGCLTATINGTGWARLSRSGIRSSGGAADRSTQEPARGRVAARTTERAIRRGHDVTRRLYATATVHGLRWISFGRTIVEIMMMGSLVVLGAAHPAGRRFGPTRWRWWSRSWRSASRGRAWGVRWFSALAVTREHLQAGQAIALGIGFVLAGPDLCGVAGRRGSGSSVRRPPRWWRFSSPLFSWDTRWERSRSPPGGAALRSNAPACWTSPTPASGLAVAIGLAVAGLGAQSLVLAALAGGLVFDTGGVGQRTAASAAPRRGLRVISLRYGTSRRRVDQLGRYPQLRLRNHRRAGRNAAGRAVFPRVHAGGR